MTPSQAVKLAVANMVLEGLDDVLPVPFEIELLRKDVALQKTLEKISLEKLTSFFNWKKKAADAFEVLSLLPISHVLVQKKEAFDFRKIAIIRPEDLVIYNAAAFMIAEPFEKARRSVLRGRVFSYRFRPEFGKGRAFDPKYNIRSFQATSAKKSRLKSVNYLVKCDVSNFYDRTNIHRIESTLLTTFGIETKHAKLVNQILLHWARRDSYGLPVGSNGSRVLAEVALFNVDSALKDAGIKFIRFVDDFRIFTNTASEAHSGLTMLIDFLNREGLFINTQKTSIERIGAGKSGKAIMIRENHHAEKLAFREFRIVAGYGGTIPIKFRMPTKRSQRVYLKVDLTKAIKKIRSDDNFAQPGQIRELLYGIIIQEKFGKLYTACSLVEMFPQFYPLLVDILVKNAEHIPRRHKKEITAQLSEKLRKTEFLSEFTASSIVHLIGIPDYFDRDSVMDVIRKMRRNAGTYFGRVAFDATQNLDRRVDALEIREYFDRSNEWERRRIIRLMSNVLPEEECRAWRRAIKSYISKDPFASAIK